MKTSTVIFCSIISILAGLLILQAVYARNAPAKSDSFIQISHNNQSLSSSCSFLIFKNYGNINDTAAKNCETGSVEYSANDSAAVMNYVMHKINDKGGGIVVVKGYGATNPYLIRHPIIIPDNGHLTFIGDGPEFTVLKVPAGYDNNLFEFLGEKKKNSFFNEFRNFEGIGNRGAGGFTNSGFLLNSSGYGVSDSLWFNIFLRDFKQDDIYFGQHNSWNNKIDSSTIELAGRAGLYRSGGIESSDARIVNSKFLFNHQYGVYDKADFGTYTSNWFYKNEETALKIDAGAKSVVVANRFQDNGISANSTYYDLWITGSYNDVSGNVFYGSEKGLNVTESAVKVDSRSTGNLITNNVIGSGEFGLEKINAEPGSGDNIASSNQGWNPVGVVSLALSDKYDSITPTGGDSKIPLPGIEYTVKDTDLLLTSSGGIGVSITIKDAKGNTVVDGLNELQAQMIPQGFKVDFGRFSTAPKLTFAFN